MKNARKLFVVSDVHGHFTALRQALDEAGFDENNENHVFLSCGDLLDRGEENHKVYAFVKGLKHKILLRGNHEDMLFHCLFRGHLTDLEYRNGTDVTLLQLLGADAVDGNGRFDREAYGKQIDEVIAFIDAMSDYYETNGYIFTHGWLPITVDGRRPALVQNWREASDSEWEEARWLEWQQLYGTEAMPEGKTVVCGHRPSRLGYLFDPDRASDCSDLFLGDGLVVVDSGTVRSGRVNVFVVEEEKE